MARKVLVHLAPHYAWELSHQAASPKQAPPRELKASRVDTDLILKFIIAQQGNKNDGVLGGPLSQM